MEIAWPPARMPATYAFSVGRLRLTWGKAMKVDAPRAPQGDVLLVVFVGA